MAMLVITRGYIPVVPPCLLLKSPTSQRLAKMEVVAPWPTPGDPQKYWEINGKTEVFIAGPPKYGRS